MAYDPTPTTTRAHADYITGTTRYTLGVLSYASGRDIIIERERSTDFTPFTEIDRTGATVSVPIWRWCPDRHPRHLALPDGRCHLRHPIQRGGQSVLVLRHGIGVQSRRALLDDPHLRHLAGTHSGDL